MHNQNKHYLHGGDLDTISQIYDIPREDIIDFSGNINPLGISPLAKKELAGKLDFISTYPDRNYISLRNGIANFNNVNPDYIVVGNGSTELISLLIQMKKPKNVLALGPTYSEYEREILLANGQLNYIQLKEELDFKLDIDELLSKLSVGIDMLIICNPNNPTSTCLYSSQLEIILTECVKKNIFVMIDETYVEFTDNMEDITAASLITKYNNFLQIHF